MVPEECAPSGAALLSCHEWYDHRSLVLRPGKIYNYIRTGVWSQLLLGCKTPRNNSDVVGLEVNLSIYTSDLILKQVWSGYSWQPSSFKLTILPVLLSRTSDIDKRQNKQQHTLGSKHTARSVSTSGGISCITFRNIMTRYFPVTSRRPALSAMPIPFRFHGNRWATHHHVPTAAHTHTRAHTYTRAHTHQSLYITSPRLAQPPHLPQQLWKWAF